MGIITIILVAACLIILLLLFCEREKRRSLELNFPPISDAEFLERCDPGTNPDIALRVRRIVSESLGVEYERIYPSSRFVEDLGAD